ncbi:branched-chain amino acid ABC transporter permease [Eoetvoesiella caeni]
MDAALTVTLLNLAYQGLVLALVVLGLGVVFGMLGVMNMAHGEFLMIGAYCAVAAQNAGVPILWGAALAILVCGALGWLTHYALIRQLRDRPFDTLLATWGLSILLRKLVELFYGRGYQNVEPPVSGSVPLLGVEYPAYRLLLMAFIIVLFAALVLWYWRSPAGARLRAMIGNPILAQAVGLDTNRLACVAFMCGVISAGIAGALLAPMVRVEPGMGLDYLLSSFFVLVVGGLGSLLGLAAGTGIVSGAQVLFATLFDQTSGYLAVLGISILFLWLKPDGLVSRR